YNLETELCHLPDSERAVEDADVRVNAHQSDVRDPFLFAEVVDLLTVVADAVEAKNVEGGMLASPRIRAYPILDDGIIAAARAIVDRKIAFLLGVARATGQNRFGRRSRGCALHSQALRRALIEFHGIAGGVDDHHTQTARGADRLVHPGR